MLTNTKRWSELTDTEKALIIGAGAVQVALAGAAWWDLAHRPAALVRGPKPAWAVGIAVNFVGPLSYFAFGRRRV